MRLLVRDGVSTEAVKQLAAGRWFLWNRIEGFDDQPLTYEWATNPAECRIRYVDDHRLGLRWFDVEGSRVEPTVELLRQGGFVCEKEDVIAACAAAKTEAEGVWAAYKLAVIAVSGFDAELFGCFGDLADHRMPMVRRALVYAMEHARWRELAGVAEPMAEDDPDEGVRNAAAAFLRTLA